jgi:hypothetical protein
VNVTRIIPVQYYHTECDGQRRAQRPVQYSNGLIGRKIEMMRATNMAAGIINMAARTISPAGDRSSAPDRNRSKAVLAPTVVSDALE